MSPDLQALFTQHKPVVLGAAAAGVVGLALLKKRTAGSSSSTTSTSAAPAGSVVSSGSLQSAYPNTTASDVYNSLQPTLAQILQQQNAATSAGNARPLTAPAPIASTLFSPSQSGTYVSQTASNGAGTGVFEVESDGSLYHLSGNDWSSIIQSNGGKAPTTNSIGPDIGTKFYNVATNLSAKNGGTAPTALTTNAQGNYVPWAPSS